jgi:hypothetical protein
MKTITPEVKQFLDAAKHYDTQMWIIPSILFPVVYFILKGLQDLNELGELCSWSGFFISTFGAVAVFILAIVFAKGRSYQLSIQKKLKHLLRGDSDGEELSVWNVYSGYSRCDCSDVLLLKAFRNFRASNWFLRLAALVTIGLSLWSSSLILYSIGVYTPPYC